MKLKRGELRIYYSLEFVNEEERLLLEKQLEDLLMPFGYVRWASSADLETNVRDLAFEKV